MRRGPISKPFNIRYYEEPFFQARTGDYFHGAHARHTQAPGRADLPGKAHIDWIGVRAVKPAPPSFSGVRPPGPAPKGQPIDPADYGPTLSVDHPATPDDGLA